MQRPDIILIVLDTQRADRLGCYGYRARETSATLTPNLDKFADCGAVFDQAISPAQWTIPSHASMFTGLYPSVHQVTQSNHGLGLDRPHLIELLRDSSFQTIGFCNNPLVGVLNNGFKRGFEAFYSYGGAIPSMPQHSTRLPWPFNKALESYTQLLRRLSYPIQNYFGRSDVAFRISLSPWLTPLWSRMANFKGQNARSVRDVTRFLQTREESREDRPLLLFLNLMETHLPYWPPGEFVDQFAPYMRNSSEAREIMRRWNREAYRWAAPLAEPLGRLEAQVLSDMYDTEVGYQDNYLGQLFETLGRRANANNTLTIIVSDHGDGLGEHGFFGHAFVAYQELVHVPLIIHWPRRIPAGIRVGDPVSTRRIYHTILDAAGAFPDGTIHMDPVESRDLTLLGSIFGRDPEIGTAFSEIYSPLNFAKAVRRRQPELLERFRCMSLRRAVVKGNMKLISVDGQPDELFDLETDQQELKNVLRHLAPDAALLNQELNDFVRLLESQSVGLFPGPDVKMGDDDRLLQQLRGLGYID